MRLLGPALVIAALVLSTGGVAHRTNAESAAQIGSTPVETGEQAQVPAAAADPEACAEQKARKMERVEIDVTERAHDKGVVSLNTRGYNYTDPDPQPGQVPERPKDEPKSK